MKKLKEIENINIPEPTDLKFYEDEISNLTNETNSLKEQISAMMKDVESLKANYEKANAEYTKSESEQKQHFDHIDELKNSFDQLENQRNSLNNAITHYNKLLCDVLANEKEVTGKLGTQEVELNASFPNKRTFYPKNEIKFKCCYLFLENGSSGQ
jgi:chromosome segregation ATPase